MKGITTDGYVLDHLHRAVEGCHNKWKYPKTEHIQVAEKEHIEREVILLIGILLLIPRDYFPTLENKALDKKITEKAFSAHVK